MRHGQLLKRRYKRKMDDIRSQRLIEGFYYTYMHPEEIGDRSRGWLMMARDKDV